MAQLREQLCIDEPVTSKQLDILRKAGFVTRTHNGACMVYVCNEEKFKKVLDILKGF